jgi:hypothetical protein
MQTSKRWQAAVVAVLAACEDDLRVQWDGEEEPAEFAAEEADEPETVKAVAAVAATKPAAQVAKAKIADPLRHLVVADGRIVLATEGFDDLDLVATSERADTGDAFAVVAAVDAKKLPPRWQDIAGRTFRLYDGARLVCLARVARLVRVTRVHTSFDYQMKQRCDEDGGACAETDTVTDDQVLDYSSAQSHLAAEIESPDACSGATWARSATLPLPQLAEPEAASKAWRQAALGAAAVGDATVTVVRAGDSAWVLAELGVESSVRLVWHVAVPFAHAGRGDLDLVATTTTDVRITGGADLDGDGVLELLNDDGQIVDPASMAVTGGLPELETAGDEGC